MLRRTGLTAAIIAAMSFSVSTLASVPAGGSVGDVPFPSPDQAWLKRGDFVNIENLRQMKRGLGKAQVRLLLGNPHFKEGIAGVSEWNYIFNFRTGVGEEFITCQYQVDFVKDPAYVVESMHWDGPACLDLINKPEPVAQMPAVKRSIELSADALFAFSRYGAADILPTGREQLSGIAAQLKGAGAASITVVGYTDRIGSEADNQLLSERRAQTVRGYLIDQGVPAGAITAEGRGESEPVTQCETTSRQVLIACLTPNRRVSIRVTSDGQE